MKLVKSPSVLLMREVNSGLEGFWLAQPVLPNPFKPMAPELPNPLFHHIPNSVMVIAARTPEFHVAVQAMRYCPVAGLLFVPLNVFGAMELGVTNPVVDCDVAPVPVPQRMYHPEPVFDINPYSATAVLVPAQEIQFTIQINP